MLSGGPACIKWTEVSGVCRVLHLSIWALLGSTTGAQDRCPCSVPEPLHLMLPMELLVDAPVDQCSIGTPVVSISDCFSFFDEAIVLDDRNW